MGGLRETARQKGLDRRQREGQCSNIHHFKIIQLSFRKPEITVLHSILDKVEENRKTNMKENLEREARIDNEAIVDCYNEEERAMGWYSYLESKIKFPFTGKCIRRCSTSPLKEGQSIEVSGMAEEEICGHDMFVKIVLDGERIDVPLFQIDACNGTEKTREAVADWHYWKTRGYEF